MEETEEEIEKDIERLRKELIEVFNSDHGKEWLKENRQRSIERYKKKTTL